MKALPLALVLLPIAACSTYVENRTSDDYAPVYPEQAAPAAMASGGIYDPARTGLFATDRRAAHVGDILTVALSERFSATKSQNAAAARSDSYSLSLPQPLPGAGTLAGGSSQSFTGKGSAAQSNSLSGQMSVMVVRELPGGELEIRGQKKLTLNNGDEYIRLSGIVRQEDISSDNVVMSDRIANADIRYVGAGDVADTGKAGWLHRLITTVSP